MKTCPIYINDRVGQEYKTGGKTYIRKSIEYEVGETQTKYKVFNTEPETSNRKGKRTFTEALPDARKYCFSVPTGMLLLRKNNFRFVTGNSGKSVLIAAILASLGVKSLIIAHMSMLTKQLAVEIGEATNADISELSATNMKLKDVNIATSQFISKRPELWKEIKHGIGCIIIDESETAASLTTLRILQRAHARYRVFVSATFSRSTDHRTEALRDLSGPKMIDLVRPDLLVPNVMMVSCEEVYPEFSSKHRFVKEKHNFFRHQSIFDKILFITKKSLEKSRYILIATDIIDMQLRLEEDLSPFGVGVLNGKTSKKERERILEEFNSGKLRILIGAAVLNAGLSVPRVSTIIRVSFPSSPEKNVQLVGRSLRDFDGKDGAYIFDLVFTGQNPGKRIAGYKANGYKVTRHTWETLKSKL